MVRQSQGAVKLTYELGVPQIDEKLGGIPRGTSLLVKESSFTGKDEILDEAVSKGFEDGEGTVYVTTNDPAVEILDGYNNKDSFGVVDCVSKEQDVKKIDGTEEENVAYADSPSDMTGIGVKVSDLLSEFRDERDIEKNRVLVDSVSTLLMYSNLETVFRFLHVFTGRIRSIDGLGIFVLDSAMHDEREYTTLRQLFDGVVEVEEGEGETRVRIVGLTDEPTEWVTLD